MEMTATEGCFSLSSGCVMLTSPATLRFCKKSLAELQCSYICMGSTFPMKKLVTNPGSIKYDLIKHFFWDSLNKRKRMTKERTNIYLLIVCKFLVLELVRGSISLCHLSRKVWRSFQSFSQVWAHYKIQKTHKKANPHQPLNWVGSPAHYRRHMTNWSGPRDENAGTFPAMLTMHCTFPQLQSTHKHQRATGLCMTKQQRCCLFHMSGTFELI